MPKKLFTNQKIKNSVCRNKTCIQTFARRAKCNNCQKAIKPNKSGYCQKCVSQSEEYRDKASKIKKAAVVDGSHKGWKTRNIISYAERVFIDVLAKYGITDYSFNHPVEKRSLGLNDNSRYFLDFYFKDKNIDLEIDGKQHELPERKAHDAIRDKLLTQSGIKVYRIRWRNFNNPKYKNLFQQEVDNFLKFYHNN